MSKATPYRKSGEKDEDGYIGRKTGTISERISDTGIADWIKFGLLSVLVLLFFVWTLNPWVLLWELFFVDVYVTRYVSWDWWKKIKAPLLRMIFSWIDAIVFALVAVYIINIYLFQNYKIPTSSLEKSLLVGDYLFVSKVSYGPRSPMTPLAFPLAQHTLPFFDCKSYIDRPQWDYKRLPGLSEIAYGDIVVFNFPAGDTVPLKVQNPDYYSLIAMPGIGRKKIWEDKAEYGEIVYRPVDRRENYVKRCVGLPGDEFLIRDCYIYRNGELMDEPENLQFCYFVESTSQITNKQFTNLGISVSDRNIVNGEWYAGTLFQKLGIQQSEDGRYNYVYRLPLTQAMKSKLEKMQNIVSVRLESDFGVGGSVYPHTKISERWTRDNYGPIKIPARGETIEINDNNIWLYAQPIRNYEGNTLEVKEDGIYINGEKRDTYTFKMNYYWMMGDNRHNSADSRYWGFVPEDHIVGKPIFIWLSIDEDTGKIRTDRIFKKVHAD